MSRATGPLSMTTRDYLKGRLEELIGNQVDTAAIRLTPLPETSQVRLDATERGADHGYGRYKGSTLLPYYKVDLSAVLAYPILYRGKFPVSFHRLSDFLRETYGVVIEAGDFDYQPTDVIVAEDLQNGLLRLTAQPTSGRWVAGSALNVRIEYQDGSLQSVIPSGTTISLSSIV